jgi:hypothetical protein
MAGGGRPSGGVQQANKKRKVAREEVEDDDEESLPEREVKTKGSSKKKKSMKKVTQPGTSTSKGDASSSSAPSDALQGLKEKFNELHRLRFTEPEKESAELKRLLSERQATSDELIERLEARVKELEGNTQTLTQARRKEKELLEELSKSREEVDRLQKNLETADKERAALVRALENVSEGAETQSDAHKLASILDVFKLLTGVTVKLDDNNSNRGSCTIYNAATKKGAKFDIILTGDDIQFTPVVNKQLLLAEHQSMVKVKRSNAPGFVSKVLATFF